MPMKVPFLEKCSGVHTVIGILGFSIASINEHHYVMIRNKWVRVKSGRAADHGYQPAILLRSVIPAVAQHTDTDKFGIRCHKLMSQSCLC